MPADNSDRAIRILTVCGSLRARSANAAVLRAASRVAGEIQHGQSLELVASASPGDLPHFNEDEDYPDEAPRSAENPESHPAVARWRGELTLADAVLLAAPEYAHGYPGLLKNALDWVVGSGQLVDKPVALLVASPGHLGGFRGQATLLQVLQAMNVSLVATRNFAAIRSKMDSAGEVVDEGVLAELRQTLTALAAAVESRPGKD